jgi:ABC-type transporter Mla subunit MlaD
MNVTRYEIRTGLLVIISLAALVAVVLYLGAPGVFTPMNTYYVYCENAAGLKPGNQVLLAGRKVGQVVKLYSPVRESERPVVNGERNLKLETLIEIRVAKSALIYKDVRVYLTQNGFLGEMLLDFTSGREWAGLQEDKGTFIAERPPGLDQAVPMVLEKIEPALKKVTETLDSLQKTADNLTALTAEGGDVQLAVEEFKNFGTNLKELTAEDGAIRLTMVNLENLTGPEGNLTKSLANIESLTNEKSDLASTMRNAEQFVAKLNNNEDITVTLRNFRKTSENLNSTVSGLSGQISSVAGNLEQATDTVKRQPWRLIWPSTKKYPEDEARPRATPPRRAEPRRSQPPRVQESRRERARATPAPKRFQRIEPRRD